MNAADNSKTESLAIGYKNVKKLYIYHLDNYYEYHKDNRNYCLETNMPKPEISTMSKMNDGFRHGIFKDSIKSIRT